MQDKKGLTLSDVALGYRTKGFGAGWNVVLSDISLRLDRGQTAVLVGGNGTGKTTLIRGVIGLLAPQEGKVELDQRPPRDCKIAYLPQAGAVIPWRRAIEDAATLLEIAGVFRQERIAIAEMTLRRIGFEADLWTKSFQLSGGQKQKVAVARCLAAADYADLIAMDEPTNFLDKESRDQFLKEFPRLLETVKCPVMVATHDRELGDVLPGLKLKISEGKVEKL